MRLMLCTLPLLAYAASVEASGATCVLKDVESAGIYLDGGTIEIVARTSCGNLKIVQDQELKTSRETKSHNRIEVNGRKLVAGGAQEYRLLRDLDKWALKQANGRSVPEFKQSHVDGKSTSEPIERALTVIALIENVCYTRGSASYPTFCKAYTAK